MSYFSASDESPTLVDRDAVLAADVYVAIVGFRYGSLLHDEADISHTEWEFDVASQAGMPRLVFVLGEDTEGPASLFVDLEFGLRQAAFRRRLANSGLTLTVVNTPEGLSEALYQALRDLSSRSTQSAEWPAIWQVPLRNPNFVGRSAELDGIRASLTAGRVVAVHALRGMGGIGKTQTVIEYAYCNAKGYDLVWWIDAEQPALMSEQFAVLGDAMGVSAAPDPTATIRAVHAALRERQRWLLVFDNAERVDDVRPYLPGGAGHVLITTRRGGFRTVGTVLDLDVLDREDAVRLLRRRAPGLDEDGAGRLAAELGDLPLALEQAAAYLDQTDLTAEDYLQLLRVRAVEMHGRGRSVDHQHTIATLWSLSVARLRQQQPEAIDLLRLCAWLAPEPIPINLFTDRPELLPRPLDRVAADSVRTADLIGTLVDHSLVRHSSKTVLLHRLVQAVLRQSIFDRPLSHPLTVVLRLLRHALPEDITDSPDSWPQWRQLLPHVLTATDYHDDTQPVAAEDLGWLLDRAAAYVFVIGGGSQVARSLLERALRIRQSIYDHDDVRVATTMHQLGVALCESGHTADARPLLERALQIRELQNGPNHPDMADSLHYLGHVLNHLGDSATALQMVERALRIQEQVLGPNHSGITATLNHLGWAYLGLGSPAMAYASFSRACRIRELVYGPNHPWTATCLNNLGRALIELDDAATAVPLLERALRIRESTYGPNHYNVGSVLSDMGAAMVDIKQFDTARSLLERALCIHGPKDHHCVYTLSALGVVLADSGELSVAQSLLERALRHRESLQDRDNIRITYVLISLSQVLMRANHPASARRHLERALHVAKTARDPAHRSLITCGKLLQQLESLNPGELGL